MANVIIGASTFPSLMAPKPEAKEADLTSKPTPTSNLRPAARLNASARAAVQRLGRNLIPGRRTTPAAGCGADRRGATAVEFALVGAPFVFLIFAILELALVFMVNISLADATETEARLVRVGQLEATGISATTTNGIQVDLADTKKAICSGIVMLPKATCLAQIQIDVRTLTGGFQGSPPSPVSGSSFNTSGLCYYSGGPGNIVEMRTYYLWPVINPVLLVGLANITSLTDGHTNTTGNWVLISDTEVMKTESVPNLTNTGSGC